MAREPGEIAECDLTPARRARILARDGHSCRYPGCAQISGLEVDHIRFRVGRMGHFLL
jgi:hypothetical protein